jgi:hypothetical protein
MRCDVVIDHQRFATSQSVARYTCSNDVAAVCRDRTSSIHEDWRPLLLDEGQDNRQQRHRWPIVDRPSGGS